MKEALYLYGKFLFATANVIKLDDTLRRLLDRHKAHNVAHWQARP